MRSEQENRRCVNFLSSSEELRDVKWAGALSIDCICIETRLGPACHYRFASPRRRTESPALWALLSRTSSAVSIYAVANERWYSTSMSMYRTLQKNVSDAITRRQNVAESTDSRGCQARQMPTAVSENGYPDVLVA